MTTTVADLAAEQSTASLIASIALLEARHETWTLAEQRVFTETLRTVEARHGIDSLDGFDLGAESYAEAILLAMAA